MTEDKALVERAEALLDRLYKSSGKAEAYGQPKAAALFAEAAKIITQLLADRATRDAQAKAEGRREAPSIRIEDEGRSLTIDWRNCLSITHDEDGLGYALFRDGRWVPGTFRAEAEPREAEAEIARALRTEEEA